MKRIVLLVIKEKKEKWRQFIQESPGFFQHAINHVLMKSLYFLGALLSLFSLSFLGLYFYTKGAQFFSYEFHLHSLIFSFAAVFIFIFRDISKSTYSIRYYAAYDRTLFVLPISWKNIYVSKMLERNLLTFFSLWLFIGLSFVSYMTITHFSFELFFTWLFVVPVFLIQLYIFKDIISLTIAVLFAFTSQTIFSNRTLNSLLKKWSIYIVLAVVLSYILSKYSFNFYEIISYLRNMLVKYANDLLFTENPLKWISETIYLAASGYFDLRSIANLSISTTFLFFILIATLRFLEKKKVLPIKISSNSKRYLSNGRINQVTVFLSSHRMFLFMIKDLKYLIRDAILFERLQKLCSFMVITLCLCIGILLSNFKSLFMSPYIKVLIEFSLVNKSILIFFVTFLFSSILAKLPKKITSLDSEGKNIYLLKSAPIHLKQVAYAKIALHLFLIFTFSFVFVVAISTLIKVPIIYVPLFSLTTLLMCLVITLINVGSTIIFPRFDWRNPEEIGNNQKAIIFRMTEYVYLFLLIYLILVIYLFFHYNNIAMQPQEYIYIICIVTILFSGMISIALFNIAKNKLNNL